MTKEFAIIADPCERSQPGLSKLALFAHHLGDGVAKRLHGEAWAAADVLRESHGKEMLARAAAALEALSLNVGVPRDMSTEPARALRSHVRIMAAAMRQDL